MDAITVNGKEFKIIRLLGKGMGGYSYLVSDGADKYVVKQIHHEPCSYYSFGNKIESEKNDYVRLKSTGIKMPEMIEIDDKNERILKEYIDGPTAFELVLNDEMRDDYIEQVKYMCSLLYPKGINIDYFPTNFILCGTELWYIDYECNNYADEWNFENWGIKYWSKTNEFLEYVKNNK